MKNPGACQQRLYPRKVKYIHGTRRETPTAQEDQEAPDAKDEAHTRSERMKARSFFYRTV
jgi:hypothetical protein